MAVTDRKTGKYGSLFLHVHATPALASVTKFADTFDWRFETTVEMHRSTRKGEGFGRFTPGVGTSRFTCSKWIQALSGFLPKADDDLATNPAGALTAQLRCAFKLVTLATEAPDAVAASENLNEAGQQIIQGFGWVSRASMQAPFDQLITEELEIQVDGEWEFVTTT